MWAGSSTGSGSVDGSGPERDSKETFSDQWGRKVSTADPPSWEGWDHGQHPQGWRPSTEGQRKDGSFGAKSYEGSRGPSEKMVVPTFSGATNTGDEDIGSSARSYLRQVSAWRRMTRLSKDQQGLTLYQHLTDRAWIDAERLDMDRLGSPEGVDYLISWIRDRYLDVQVTQVGRSLSDFFRRLRKRDGQPMRDYMADFDRAHARLTEVGCELPDIAAAWVFVDRMCLEEHAELNLLASVNNRYSLKALQQAAIVHDRGLRKPWEGQSRGHKREWGGRKPHTANMADPEDFLDEGHGQDSYEYATEEGEGVSEEIAENLYNAYMTHETAKQRYRENSKLRGSDPEALRRMASEKLKLAKSRSFCSGCRRRGHWHKDAECPLNKGTSTGSTSTSSTSGGTVGGSSGNARDPVKANFPCHVVHVTWDLGGAEPERLLAITDTACSKSVAGAGWVDNYVDEAKRRGCEPQFLSCREAFRFGASKVFVAGYAVAICFSLGKHKVALKVAVVNGEVPLLVSRPALGQLGMIMDIAENTATFRKVGVTNMELSVTETGHPAFPIEPAALPRSYQPFPNGQGPELQIFLSEEQYTESSQSLGCGLWDDSFGKNRGTACVNWMTSSLRDFSQDPAFAFLASTPSTSEAFSYHQNGSSNPLGDTADTTSSLGQQSRTPKPSSNVFYPKKIAIVTKNLLLDDTFNAESFTNWWKSTNISNDFWVEDGNVLVRVHVVPRRSFFSPTNWNTQNLEHKALLMNSLGAVRSVHAVSCKTYRAFPEVHGTWRDDRDHSAFPMLWIGRTVFRRRRPMPEVPSPTSSPSHVGQLRAFDRPHGDEAEDSVGADQTGADHRSSRPEPVVPRDMDRSGTAFSHPGRPPLRTFKAVSHAGTRFPQDRRTEGEGDGTRVQVASVRHTRDDPPDTSGSTRDELGESHDFRALLREEVRGDTEVLQGLGGPRSFLARQSFGGTDPLCQLVASGVDADREGQDRGTAVLVDTETELRGPGSHCEDSLRGGRNIDDIVGRGVGPHLTTTGGVRSKAQGKVCFGNEAPSGAPGSDDGSGTRQGFHGTGCPGGGDRRGAGPGGEVGSATRPTRNCSQELGLKSPDPQDAGDREQEIYYDCEDNAHGAEDLKEQVKETNHDHEIDELDDYLAIDLESDSEVADGPAITTMNSGGSGDVIQRETPGVSSVFAIPDAVVLCEKTAKEKLNLKKFSYDDLLEVARLLPMKKIKGRRGSRRGGGDPYQYFLGSMYTYGKFFGIAKGSKILPWTNRFINSFARDKFKGPWTSFVLFRDTATQVHADVHNLEGTLVTTVSFGDFSGGELWMQGDNGEEGIYRESPDGNQLKGYLVPTKEKPYTFDGKNYHATQPWEGERWALSCFTTRGYPKATTMLRDELRELRFPLRGLSRHGLTEDSSFEGHKISRPMKSVRKNLWKMTSRLATLTTWCTAAASLCITENFPLSRGPDAVTLYEIGGITKTLEATEMDYVVVEPYEYDAGLSISCNISNVDKTFGEFSPSMLWIHADQPVDFINGLLPIFHKQVHLGGQLAFEAGEGHPFWTSGALNELLDKHGGSSRRRPGEPQIMRFNDLNSDDTPSNLHEDNPQFVKYVYSPDKRHLEGDDQKRANGSGQPLPGEPLGAEDATHVLQESGLRAAFVVDQERASGSGEPLPGEPRGAEAIQFEKGKSIAPEVKSSLKRLHQNMGHPSNLDLARHLRLAGADPTVVEACKRLRCQVCHRNQRGASAKPATLPNLLEFNQLVAVDAFYVYDCEGEKVELMMVVDVGTGFVSAGLLQGHSGATMESSFCSIWSNTFGAPGTMIVDLESGLQAGLGRFSEWHGTKIRPIAGQAHWQNGTVERAIRTWKEIWGRLVDEWSASSEEAGMIITAANTAMNTLRRETGFSPSQAVWGRDPQLPEDLKGTPQDDHVEHIISHDRQRAREHSLRISAKEAFFKAQNDSRLRRSLLQRSRVAGPELQQGAHVFFYRKPKNNKNWEWHGPGVIIGREGPNYWVSFAGRCHLVAPEHLRTASAEELGAAFAIRATHDDLQKLLEQDFADEDLYEGDDVDMDEDHVLGPEGQELPDAAQGPRGEAHRRPPDDSLAPRVTKRHRTKGPPAHHAEASYHEAFMMKIPKTQRGREKALEKELPWSLIPPEQHQGFKEAELKQWDEHVQHNALLPLSVEQSREVLRTKTDRVLNSRFAYRDKLWSRRRQDPSVGWKPKARLVIAGHKDPDLMEGLPTHAPTISRQGILLLLQILASNLGNNWGGYAGDVTAAFLCGGQLERELYLRQPRTGLGDLHPEQLLRIKKPIFGLVDSPAAWWTKFRDTMRSLVVEHDNAKWKVVQSTLDHCIFMVQQVLVYEGQDDEVLGSPQAYLGVHVDDVLLVGRKDLCEVLKDEISARFPIRDWEAERFDYVGSYIEIREDMVKISQASYALTRLFEIDVDKDVPDHFEASETQKHDNMSLIGALSWMASQTRPDLQVGVSMGQQRQKDPTVGDVRFTNQLARRALEHSESGLELHPIDLSSAVLLCYHDAGWANVPQSQEDPVYSLSPEEDEAGIIADGPFARKDAKAKKANSSIVSQLGGVYVLADKGVLHGIPSRGSILDWRSGACDRVCRSTFAAETMACCGATETGDYIARFLETLLTGKLERKRSRFDIRFITDCRSLYDHLTRDGVPRVPSCKRLAIDLAGIREDISSYGKIVWVPTWAQLADVLTKPLKADQWWKTIQGELKLTFVEREQCIDKRFSGTSVKLEGS